MQRGTAYEDKKTAKIANMLFTGLTINAGFTLASLPFFINLFLLNFEINYYLLLPVTSLFFFLAFGAAYACYDEWLEQNMLFKPLKLFFTYCWKQLKRHLFEWLLFGTFLSINLFNIIGMMNSSWSYLNVFFVLLFQGVLVWYLAFHYLALKNSEQSNKNLLFHSFYFTVGKWYRSLLNALLFDLMLFMMFFKPVIGFMVAPAVVISLIYLNTRGIFKDLRKETESENKL